MTDTAIIQIDNLKCAGCAGTIKNTITKLNGVSDININLDTDIVEVKHSDAISREEIVETLKRIGYPEHGTISGVDALYTQAKSYVSCAVGKINQ